MVVSVPVPTESYLTPEEVAALLRVRESTVRAWLRTGRLRGQQTVGGRWRIPASALAGWIDPAPLPRAPRPTRAEREAAKRASRELAEKWGPV